MSSKTEEIVDLEDDDRTSSKTSSSSSKEDEDEIRPASSTSAAPRAVTMAATKSGPSPAAASTKTASTPAAPRRKQRTATEDDRLLHRLLSFVFQAVMKDGTLEAFFEAKQKMFLTEDGRDGGEAQEYRIEWTVAFTEYKEIMETKLDEFATLEKLESSQELRDIIAAAVGDKRANKRYLSMILAATDDFKRFCGMMLARGRGAGSGSFAAGASIMKKSKKKGAKR